MNRSFATMEWAIASHYFVTATLHNITWKMLLSVKPDPQHDRHVYRQVHVHTQTLFCPTSDRDTTILTRVWSSVPAPFMLLYRRSAKKEGRARTHITVMRRQMTGEEKECAGYGHNILHITNCLEGVPQVSRHLPFNGIYDISLGDLGGRSGCVEGRKWGHWNM